MQIEIITGWGTFWIFLAVVYYCDHKQYMAGHNAMFFKHKTPEEKKLREMQLNKRGK